MQLRIDTSVHIVLFFIRFIHIPMNKKDSQFLIEYLDFTSFFSSGDPFSVFDVNMAGGTFRSFPFVNIVFRRVQDQDSQDQDSLLVKRRNDNHSPGPVIRELVPSSHQRSELRNTILNSIILLEYNAAFYKQLAAVERK